MYIEFNFIVTSKHLENPTMIQEIYHVLYICTHGYNTVHTHKIVPWILFLSTRAYTLYFLHTLYILIQNLYISTLIL